MTETTLDQLMDLDPLELSKDPAKLDAIIDYHRKKRAERAASPGRRAKKDTGEQVSLGDLVQKMKAKAGAAPANTITRRL